MRDMETPLRLFRALPRPGMSRGTAKLLLSIAALCILLSPLAQQDLVFAQDNSTGSGSGEVPSWINPEPFEYNPQQKPNPFEPFLRQAPSSQEEEEEDRKALSPLERITPSQLKLEGILSRGASEPSVALVQLPSGKGYILRQGTKIGTQGAHVERIESDRVIILEYFIDVMGEKKSKKTVLKLPQSAGEKNE